MPPLIRTVDSHTEGEPTRVLIEGLPQLLGTTMSERRDELQHDWDYLRTAITAEPRGSEGTVAAFLTEPVSAGAVAGVIFADRAQYIGMCGHGSIGVARTLVHLGRIAPTDRRFALDTPVGLIHAELFDDRSVEIQNVVSRAYQLDVVVTVPGVGEITGDIAYGGNWFFLVKVEHIAMAENISIQAQYIPQLTQLAERIRDALRANGITGENGAPIDHVELFGPPQRPDADAKNFVFCPDGAYDRSPCGTGTSAKMAILAARNELRAGELWRQESIIGSLFVGHIEAAEGNAIVPYIRGHAFITGETTLHLDSEDPFRYGISSA